MPYCMQCGAQIAPNQRFCLKCGRPLAAAPRGGIPQPTRPPMSYAQPTPQHPQAYRAPARKRGKAGRIVALVLGCLFLAGLAVGAVYANDRMAITKRIAFQAAFDDWKSEPGVSAESKDAEAMLCAFAAKLEAGDVNGALEYVNPDSKDTLRAQLTEHADGVRALAAALGSCKLDYMSGADSTVYYAQRAARFTGRSGDVVVSVTVVKIDGRWVVDAL